MPSATAAPPQLWAPDAKVGKVPKPLRDLLGDIPMLARPPARADFYLTTKALTAALEREAARLEAQPVVLPEAAAWLLQQLELRPGAVLVWATGGGGRR